MWTNVAVLDARLVFLVTTLALTPLDRAVAQVSTCAVPASAQSALRRETARLSRAPRARDVLRAASLLADVDAVCEASVTLVAVCSPSLAASARAVADACGRATSRLSEAAAREADIREGRRALRRLDVEAQDRDYPELVGQHEHAQLEALRVFPSDVARFVARLVELEGAIADASEAQREGLSNAVAGLRAVRLRLESLALTTARDLQPPAR